MGAQGDEDKGETRPDPRAEGPLPPPKIPFLHKLRGRAARAVPIAIWLGALGLAIGLYQTETTHGDVFAFAEAFEVNITPSIDGRIATAPLEIGQAVKVGELLVTLDTTELDEKIRLAKLDLEQMPKRLGEALRVEFVGGEPGGRVTTFGQDGQRIKVMHDKLAAQQEADRAELAAIRPQLARLSDLVDKKLIPADEVYSLSLKRAVLEKRIAARAQLITQSKGRLDIWAEEEARLGEQRVAALLHAKESYKLTSPIAGKVDAVLHRPGEFVVAGTPIAQILIQRPRRMVAFISDGMVPKVKIGGHATLRVRTRPGDPLEGVVIEVGPRVEDVPARLRFVPMVAQWGRRIVIELVGEPDILPGEVYNVRFHR